MRQFAFALRVVQGNMMLTSSHTPTEPLPPGAQDLDKVRHQDFAGACQDEPLRRGRMEKPLKAK